MGLDVACRTLLNILNFVASCVVVLRQCLARSSLEEMALKVFAVRTTRTLGGNKHKFIIAGEITRSHLSENDVL